MATAKLIERPKQIYYPESDGQPMAETDIHRDQMIDLILTLKEFYRDVPNVYVSGNLLIYYEEGNIYKRVAPDVFVVKGVPKQERRTYRIWEEGKGPDVVIEVTSEETRREDQHDKRDLYQQVLKVSEYFLHDPTGDYLRPPLQGYRLVKGAYRACSAAAGGSGVSPPARGTGGTAPAPGSAARCRPVGMRDSLDFFSAALYNMDATLTRRMAIFL